MVEYKTFVPIVKWKEQWGLVGWESCFGEESGLPFIPTHFSSLYFTHTLTHTLLTLAAAATLWSAPHFARAARFRIGIRAERSTPRKLGGSSAKAPWKLGSSTAMQHVAGSRSGYSLNFAFTLE